MDNLTRCLNCLRLSQQPNGRCVFEDCVSQRASVVEDRGRFLMTCHGYRLNRDYVWLVENDDPENFQEVEIGAFRGTWADAFRLLIQHGMPKTPNIICGNCRTNEVEFLGDDCFDCAKEAADWQRAGV